jgi:hypothetical protein
MKLTQILAEIEYFTYIAMVQIDFEDVSSNKMADLLRALPNVTRVTIGGTAGIQETKGNFEIKCISQAAGTQAFEKIKGTCLQKYGSVVKTFIIDVNTISREG